MGDVKEVGDKMQKQVQIGVHPTVKPLFADRVIVVTLLQSSKKKDETGKIRKEGHIKICFVDAMKNQIITEVVTSLMTAKDLTKILDDNIKKLDEELKSGEPPKMPKITTTTEAPRYIG